MKRNRIIFFLFLLFSPLFARTEVLEPENVNQVMEQLFYYHIDKKEMSPLIVERSFSSYLKNFDPNCAYLLLGEVRSYIEPTDDLLNRTQSDFNEDQITTYMQINDTIGKSIKRARVWRQEWAQNPVALIEEAKKLNFSEPLSTTYPLTEEKLKAKHRAQFVRLVAINMEGISTRGKEKKLVKLSEKQITLLENPYIGKHDSGKKMSKKLAIHHVTLRTLKSLAHSLDAHTAYFSSDEAYAMRVQLEKGMCGIGVILREGIEGIIIQEILEGGPAQKNGDLKVGDTIIEIDGKTVQESSFRHVLEVMRGEEGSAMTLGIKRGDDKEYVRLVRSKIQLNERRVDVTSESYKDGVIGTITLHSFYEGKNGISSEQDIKKAITELREEGPLYGLVLDMRDNGGGFLTQAVKVSGIFISSGVVVISKYSDDSIKYYRAVDGERFFDGPLVVLVNRGSASATEIVAQTLQDYGVALVVGDEQTYGKGTIQHQTVTNEKSKSFFKVTIGRYYTVSGRSTQIDGVKADILVPTALQYEQVGEVFTEYPLSSDHVAPAFDDQLLDVDPFAKRWFAKYYLPTIQSVQTTWKSHIPALRTKSQLRQLNSPDFSALKTGTTPEQDIQLQESIHIVRDMIPLHSKEPLIHARFAD